ncbi:DUF4145 domain-containing protein [Bartonella sp. HY406]|uniref:DUF4145 domain-containing protein n=1 Tax=Bartonella sp. HY406 TaxID=2979331 RepID=UPI0021C65179|nr:DUF4145 domain-containing protein [Bartonella sp. HY406]UXN05010.1 DUF4145 domain-containing protein [Bartonella sp. HY406]
MSHNIIKNYCGDCCNKTNHSILFAKEDLHKGEYRYAESYEIVQCLGCDKKSFRKVFYDIEAEYLTFDDDWQIPEDVTIYPKAIEGHKKIDSLSELPDVVRIIYSEVINALQENSKILAGLGLRATVEAVCNDLKILGRNLEQRINKLASNGYISKTDAERLHGIRFMGNDAAHEIKTPKDATLSVALQIIEHLIASVYILDKKANGNIETTVSKYELFEELLIKELQKFKGGDEYPIAKFLSEKLRRVKENIETLEQELISKIQSGQFTKLSIGKVDTYQGSKKQLHHFIVQ